MSRLEIRDYDAHWPALYERECQRILGAFGGEAVAVEHIGSTAVPGLSAKPVIDILAGLHSQEVAPDSAAALKRLGYRRVRVRANRIYFRKAGPPRCFLHVVQFEGGVWRRYLLFRDFLRAHSEEAALYDAFKRQAYAGANRGGYARSKRAYIAAAVGRARAEQRRRLR